VLIAPRLDASADAFITYLSEKVCVQINAVVSFRTGGLRTGNSSVLRSATGQNLRR